MKKFFQYMLMAAFIGGTVSFTSCNDDDENQVNEWNMSYVSLLQSDYLRPIESFTLKHVEDKGIEGSVEYKVMATLNKPTSQDVTVNITATCDSISADKVILSSNTATIKAGETKSEDVTISITDWSDIVTNNAECDMVLTIQMDGISTTAADITNSEFNQSIKVNIKKEQAKPEEFLFFGYAPENSTLMTNKTDWTFEFMEGVENPNSNTVAGTGGNDVATNGVPFWFTVDFGEVYNVTGIQTRHWGAGYAPTEIEVFTSDNGTDWKSMNTVQTYGSAQAIAFKEPRATRYLKYQMITVPGRVDVTAFYVYVANE